MITKERLEELESYWNDETNDEESQEWRDELTEEEEAYVYKLDETFEKGMQKLWKKIKAVTE